MDKTIDQSAKQYEPINFTYYDPAHSLFKSGKSDYAFYRVFTCCNKENCDAYKRGKCVLLNGLYGQDCPYGKRYETKGPTKAAKSLYGFIGDAKKKYADVQYKLSYLTFTCQIGEYIYIDLPFLKNYENPIPEEMVSDGHMIKSDLFTVEFIKKLIKFKPRALFGGEITRYQREDAPKFVAQIKKYFPDKYVAVVSDIPEVEDMVQKINYVDKYALVTSLLPGKVKLNASIISWDGNVLRAKGNAIPFWSLSDEEVIVIPNEKTFVKIVENETVTDETVFRDA